MRRLLMAALAAGLAAPGAAPFEARAGDETGLVTALRAQGSQVLALGARGGLEGYFVTPARGAGYSLYVTGDGHAVAGLLYAPDGAEVTGMQLAAARGAGTFGDTPPEEATTLVHAAPDGSDEPVPESSARLFERSAGAFGFTLGESGPVVVLFGDAACRWSRAAAAKLGTEALAGRLRLHVVPVAVLGTGAAQGAAAIAASPDPARAWFEGPTRPADRQGASRIARNNALLDAWGADAVPLIVWRTGDGSVHRRIGDIDDMRGWLQETLGPVTLVPQTLGPDTLRAGDTRAGDPRAGHPQGGDARGGRQP